MDITKDLFKRRLLVSEHSLQMVSWTETILITGAFLGMGFYWRPDDPFFLDTRFPWGIMAPFILGLRYGFYCGFASALAIICALLFFLDWNIQAFPLEFMVGILLVAMIAGQFHDDLDQRYKHLSEVSKLQKVRLDEFSRVYHVLKASHRRMEQQVLGSTVSLRAALNDLYGRMLKNGLGLGNASTDNIGDEILSFLSKHGWLEMATIYEVSAERQLVRSAMGRLGNPKPVSALDPLVKQALRTAKIASISEGIGNNCDHVLMAIPLVDVTGRIWALVAVNQIPLMALRDKNLSFLAVLGGHLGDMFMYLATVGVNGSRIGHEEFMKHLNRSLIDLHHANVSATLTAFVFPHPAVPNRIADTVFNQVRCYDKVFVTQNNIGQSVLLILQLLVDKERVDSFLSRLENVLAEKHDSSISNEGGILVYKHFLKREDSPGRLLSAVVQHCLIQPNFAIYSHNALERKASLKYS